MAENRPPAAAGKSGYARRVAARARTERADVQDMRVESTRLELTRRLRAELKDAVAGAAALAALAAGDAHALPAAERVDRMRVEAQRLDLQLRVRRELRGAAYGAGKLAETAGDPGDSAGRASASAQDRLTDRRRRAAAMLKLADRHSLDPAVLDLDRTDRQALGLTSPPAERPPEPDPPANAAQDAQARLAQRADRAAGALQLADRFGLDLALAELDRADRAALSLPDA